VWLQCDNLKMVADPGGKPEDGDNFVTFIKALREGLGPQGIITFDVRGLRGKGGVDAAGDARWKFRQRPPYRVSYLIQCSIQSPAFHLWPRLRVTD
jgi:hypothetical protein